ncbi:hypothetical protein [Halofilum ochraceum]|uniref:hypothetical protein n=1 Tax=Halofilum ochraceum TaxID=1611323 RepID=UPI0008DB0040|nr:hypothetical protein [Halofilum ochraceum]
MTWTENYWDIVGEFYWVPSYLGLKSIPRRDWTIDGDMVSIPREMTNASGPLYRRVRSGEDYWKFFRRQEETFNHIFNLTLSVLPGDIVSEIFKDILGLDRIHDYQLCGAGIRDRYSWIGGANVTTPDAFLVSAESVLAIEIKFNAKTSLDQLAKYIALIAGEKIEGHAHENLNLLYISPSLGDENFRRQTSLEPDKLSSQDAALLERSVSNPQVKALFEANRAAIMDVVSRLQVTCATWVEVLAALDQYRDTLSNTRGDRTLRRLLDGLATEIRMHPLSRVEDERPVGGPVVSK